MRKAKEEVNQKLLLLGEVRKIVLETSPTMQPFKTATYQGFRLLRDQLCIPMEKFRPAWAQPEKNVPLRFQAVEGRATLISYNVGDGWTVSNAALLSKLAQRELQIKEILEMLAL